MNILVIGCDQVGAALVRDLERIGHDISLIEIIITVGIPQDQQSAFDVVGPVFRIATASEDDCRDQGHDDDCNHRGHCHNTFLHDITWMYHPTYLLCRYMSYRKNPESKTWVNSSTIRDS